MFLVYWVHPQPNTANETSRLARRINESTVNIVRATARTLEDVSQNISAAAKKGVANIAFSIGEKTQDVSGRFGFAFVKFGYLFVNGPTIILDTKVVQLSSTSATISWVTNHPANGKVNYGLTADYGQNVQSEKRVTHHEFTITNLKPNTTYHYEVMSHNKNYVYDANHIFLTPEK